MHDPFEGAGELRDLYLAVDWEATGLGAPERWSPTLLSTLRTALETRFPVTLFWGPDRVMLYNEAYVAMIGDKHPAALASPTKDVFPEIWDTIGPMLDQAATGAGGTWVHDLQLLMDRHGYLEETYFTFSYSAVTGPDGEVEGVIDIAAETTSQVIGTRRLQTLYRLNARLADVPDETDLVAGALEVLREAANDLTTVDFVRAAPDGMTTLGEADGGVLVAGLGSYLIVDEAFEGFLRLIRGSVSQALDRIRIRRAERRLADMERAMSETLQRSLLTNPVRPDGLQVAVRYRSSIAQAHIGGDWYDAFQLPGGALTLAIGDVSGHDRDAAAAMAQVRNLLRGIAFTVGGPPSLVLTHLSDAMAGLAVNAFATVVLAQIEPGTSLLRWSNAGHPPPVLLGADGTVTLLETAPETLLGMRVQAARHDHAVELAPGATVILYTDGLIERRGTDLDGGLRQLTAALAGWRDPDPEALCDHLLDHFAATAEDDIALTVVRAASSGAQSVFTADGTASPGAPGAFTADGAASAGAQGVDDQVE